MAARRLKLAIMRSMAGRWSDEHIAASLNRMGLPTGQGKTWTAHRVSSVRRVRGIHAYRSAEKDGEWLTLTEAAAALRVTSHTIRRLIKSGVLPAVQVVPARHTRFAPTTWRRNRSNLRWPEKVARVASLTTTRFQCLQTLEEGMHNDSSTTIGRMLRSTMSVSRSMRPSSRTRVSPFQ